MRAVVVAVVAAVFVAVAAAAQSFPGGPFSPSSSGGGAGGFVAAAYCAVVGGAACTMTGDTVMGSSAVGIQCADNACEVKDSAGGTDLTLLTVTSSQPPGIMGPSGTSGARVGFNGNVLQIGSGATAATSLVAALGTSPGSTSMAEGFGMYGQRTARFFAGTALVVASPTDTTSTPLTSAGTACRMSSVGASSWTPSETGAADGMFYCCTNTGADTITMQQSAGVYQGPSSGSSSVKQWGTVCFEYVTDRWVERSFSNNN